MCRHTEAEEIGVPNQKLSCKFFLIRKLDLLKSSVSTSFYNFVTKIFWLKAEVLDVLDPDFVIEKIRKYTTLASKEMTNRVTTSSLNVERYIIFKKINNKIVIDIEGLEIINHKKLKKKVNLKGENYDN